MGRLKLFGEQEGDAVANHSALQNLDYATAGHTGFLSLATPQTVTAEKIIDSAVGLRFGHDGGPLLQGAASGDDLAVTGDVLISGILGIPSFFAPTAVLSLSKTFSAGFFLMGTYCNVVASGGSALFGIHGGCQVTGPAPSMAKGLDFRATSGTSANMTLIYGAEIGVTTTASGSPQTAIAGIYTAGWGTGKPTTAKGVYVQNFGAAGVGTVYGIHIYNQSGATTNINLEVGPSTPYFRVEGGAAPAGINSSVIVNFGGTLYRLTRNTTTGAVETAAV